MALPPGITPKTVTVGIASFFDGTLAEGTVTITAPVNVVHTPSNRPVFSSQMSKRFIDGEASFNLAPTDAEGLNRKDWTYKLNVVISGALVQPDPIYFTLPVAGPDVIDLDALVPVPSSAGTPISVAVLTAEDLDGYTAQYIGDEDSQTRAALEATFGSVFTATAATTVAEVNTWLAGGGVRRLTGTLTLTGPLIIRSNTHLDATGAVINLATTSNMLQNYSVANPHRTVADAAITSGSKTLTSATAAFTSADVGRTVIVAGAVTNAGPLTADIAQVVNATTVTLSVAATRTVSAAAARIHDRDHDITIVGGTWNRGANGSAGGADENDTHSLFFRHVDRLTVKIERFTSQGGKYGIAPGDVTQVLISGGTFDSFSAAVQFTGPVRQATVENLTGTSLDDFVAFGCDDYIEYWDTTGDLDQINIRNLQVDKKPGDVSHFISMFSNAGTNGGYSGKARRIVIENISGTNTGVPVGLGGPGFNVDQLTIRSVNATTGGNTIVNFQGGLYGTVDVTGIGGDQASQASASGFSLVATSYGTTIRTLKVSNSGATYTRGLGNPAVVWVGDGSTVTNLLASSIGGDLSSGVAGSCFRIDGTVGTLQATACEVVIGSGGFFLSANWGSHLTRAVLTGCTAAGNPGVQGQFVNVAETATVGSIALNECSATNLYWSLGAFSAAATVSVNGHRQSGGNALYVAATGNLTVLGSGAINLSGTYYGDPGYILRVNNPGFPIDLAMITAKSAGDMATNTNAGLACGAGRVISNGTNWKNLYSGATY